MAALMHEIARVDDEKRCYFVQWRGEVNFVDVIDEFLEIANDQRIKPGFDALHDFTEARASVEFGEIMAIARRYAEISEDLGDGRGAVVVGNDADYGIVRVFMALADEIPGAIHVFRSREDAKLWLRLPEAYPLPFGNGT